MGNSSSKAVNESNFKYKESYELAVDLVTQTDVKVEISDQAKNQYESGKKSFKNIEGSTINLNILTSQKAYVKQLLDFKQVIDGIMESDLNDAMKFDALSGLQNSMSTEGQNVGNDVHETTNKNNTEVEKKTTIKMSQKIMASYTFIMCNIAENSAYIGEYEFENIKNSTLNISEIADQIAEIESSAVSDLCTKTMESAGVERDTALSAIHDAIVAGQKQSQLSSTGDDLTKMLDDLGKNVGNMFTSWTKYLGIAAAIVGVVIVVIILGVVLSKVMKNKNQTQAHQNQLQAQQVYQQQMFNHQQQMVQHLGADNYRQMFEKNPNAFNYMPQAVAAPNYNSAVGDFMRQSAQMPAQMMQQRQMAPQGQPQGMSMNPQAMSQQMMSTPQGPQMSQAPKQAPALPPKKELYYEEDYIDPRYMSKDDSNIVYYGGGKTEFESDEELFNSIEPVTIAENGDLITERQGVVSADDLYDGDGKKVSYDKFKKEFIRDDGTKIVVAIKIKGGVSLGSVKKIAASAGKYAKKGFTFVKNHKADIKKGLDKTKQFYNKHKADIKKIGHTIKDGAEGLKDAYVEMKTASALEKAAGKQVQAPVEEPINELDVPIQA
jgi:uncharacterized membrane-anchored protein YhcB (DUF1043 family)